MAGFIGSPSMNFVPGVVRDGAVDIPPPGARPGSRLTLRADRDRVYLFDAGSGRAINS